MGVLTGIRVLDFGRYIAGPYCAALLAELGAEVIRVEKVSGSEDRYLLPVGPDGAGAPFLQMNRNKRGMTLNPMKPAGREVVRRLVASADVVVANLPLRGLEAMGLDYPALRAIREDVILVTATAFGNDGPYGGRVGFDALGYVMSGGAHITGHAEEPMRDTLSVVDFGTAMMAAFGTMAALMHRERTGEGQVVEGALLHTALTYASPYLIEQAMTGRDRVATGNRSQLGGPADVLRVRDGWIMVQVIGHPLFERWARMVGRPELLDDPRYAEDADRGDNGEALSEIAQAHVAGLTVDEALAAYAEASVPAGPVRTFQQALDDPHVAAMGMIGQAAYGGTHPAPLVTAPIRLSRAPAEPARAAPTLGQDTDAVLEGLGYGAAEIEALRRDRVV